MKVVQRIPVRIRIDDTAGKLPLRHGMSVEADIDDFKLLMLLSLAVMPLLLMIQSPKALPHGDHAPVLE